MVPDMPDNYPEADHSLYQDLKIPVRRIMDDEKNHHRKSACLQEMLSTSCVSGLTLEDSSWSVDLLDEEEPSTARAQDRGPTLPLRGRRSLVLRVEEEQQGDLSRNRFAAVVEPLQREPSQRSLCTPPTRRPSSDCDLLPSDSSTAMLSMDLTEAYKSFNDSGVISVDTEVLEQDANPNPKHIHKSLPLKTHSRSTHLPSTKTPRRLTPTLEVPEEQDPSHWGDEISDEFASEHAPVDCTPPTTAPLRDAGAARNNPPTKPRRNYTRESISLESAIVKAPTGNHHWGVKSSLTLDSALFDESAVIQDEPEDDCPSKRTSWAVGSSLTFETFEDSLTPIKSAGPDQDESHKLRQPLHKEGDTPVFTNDFLCPEMNRLRFSSLGDSLQKAGSERTLPSVFSSITPCAKPIRTQSIPKTSNRDSKPDSA